MIILDGPDTHKRDVSRRSFTSTTEVDSIQSGDAAPPSYRSNMSGHSLQPMLDAPLPNRARSQKVQGACALFRRGMLYALALYAIVTIAVAVPYLVTQSRKMSSYTPYQRMKPPDQINGAESEPNHTVVPTNAPSADGNVIACNVWDYSHEYGYPDNLKYSRLTYCIPNNATNVFIHALGGAERFVSGNFVLKLNPDGDETNYMIDIMLTYPKFDTIARDSSAICLMQADADNTWGVGIYTPSDSKNHSLDYQVTFLVPQHGKIPLWLTRFTTNLPWFSHLFQDLNTSLSFHNVQVTGIASAVDGVIHAENVNITTSDAPITGSYRATDTLVLQTSHAKLDTSITLNNKVGQNSTTTLYMKSSEGPFFATVNLTTPGTREITPNVKPQYKTDVSCNDSPVTLIFHHDNTIHSSQLDIDVNTTLNRAVVVLDTKFEGIFDLDSKNGSVTVTDVDGTLHPASTELAGSFSEFQQRSLVYQSESISSARGCVKRGTDSRPTDGRVNLSVRNNLSLIALVFMGTNGKLGDLGLGKFSQ